MCTPAWDSVQGLEPGTRPAVVWAAIVALISLAVIRSAIVTRTDGFTLDDAWHITAGVSYVRTGAFRLNPEHPPLVKLWVGAALVRDFHLPPFRPLVDKADERLFTENAVFLDNDPDLVQRRARVAMFALNSLLLLFLAWATSRALGSAAALCTVAFLALDPTVSAHLPVVLTDLPVALLGAAAILFTVEALRANSRLDLGLAAIALGLTLGAKHSGLITYLAVGACGLFLALMPSSVGRTMTRTRTLVLTLAIMLLALVVLWGLYGFRYTETQSGEEAFNRPLVVKIQDLRSRPARAVLSAMVAGHVLPRSYLWGLADTIRTGIEGRGHPVYFFGKTFRDGGPVYYFPVVLAAKLPLGLLALAVAGLVSLAVRRTRQSVRLPGLALLLLAAFFLCALARGVPNAGVRHALPVLVVLGIFGGIALALAATSRSRLAKVMAAVAVAAAAASAIGRIRPWEYYNELVGGPEKAYLRFADEGIDMGQRSLDLVRYYHDRLEPAGEVPYNFYPIRGQELRRRNVHVRGRGAWGKEAEEGPGAPDMTGVFLVRSLSIGAKEYTVFRETRPAERIGNLLIYRGTFHLPELWEMLFTVRATLLLLSPQPDLDRAEAYLRQILERNPNRFQTLLVLANLMLRRGQRQEAIRLYERARDRVTEDVPMREILSRQISRLSSNEPLERIPPVRARQQE